MWRSPDMKALATLIQAHQEWGRWCEAVSLLSVEVNTPKSSRSRSVAVEVWRRRRGAARRFYAAKDDCARVFAEGRGWRFSEKSFTLDMLRRASPQPRQNDFPGIIPSGAGGLIDHPEYFRETSPPYRPAAILSHSYDWKIEAHQALAADFGLVIEVLPVSWYYPGHALAVLYRRPTEDPVPDPVPRLSRSFRGRLRRASEIEEKPLSPQDAVDRRVRKARRCGYTLDECL